MSYIKPLPEYPRRMRHYFHLELPEDLRSPIKDDIKNAWIDVTILGDDGTIGNVITVQDYGVNFDGQCIKPRWFTKEILEAEKQNILHPKTDESC